MSAFHRNGLRLHLQALFFRDRAARIKPAHVGMDDGIEFRCLGTLFFPLLRVRFQNCRQEQTGVRMPGGLKDLFVGPRLDDSAEIHDGHAITHVPHNAQIMADKEIGQMKFVL